MLVETTEISNNRDRPSLLHRITMGGIAKKFDTGFWVFFTAALLFDFGFGLYFFLFNLFLANLHFRENALGLVTGALTMGNVAGSIPISMLSRRFGLRPVLLIGFIAAPLICVLRTFLTWMPAQIILAFLAGVALSSWTVCFSPTVAKLTSKDNRISAFSIVFATGIGSGTLAGLAGGYIPEWLGAFGRGTHLTNGMRAVLLAACAIAMLGIWPISRLKLGVAEERPMRPNAILHPFLRRFLPPFALWSIVTGAVTPFAAVYLHQELHVRLTHVGVIFSAAQLSQFVAVLLAPLLLRRLGPITGIICTQLATGVAIFALSQTQNSSSAIALYLAFTGLQFMSGPGIYSLLMNQFTEGDRSTASAVQNMVGATAQGFVAVVAGMLVVSYGYPVLFMGTAGTAVAAALLLYALLREAVKHPAPSVQVAEST